MSDVHDQHAGHEHGHDHAAHDPNLAHHFGSMEQQFESGKLGMWVFLATEILMFGGLFCAYAIYRGNHPEIFLYAHKALDTNLGAINTGVLLASSLTMAWAVLAIAKGQRGITLIMLALTFCGGIGFMGIKTKEYYDKWNHALMIGTSNAFYQKDGAFQNVEDKLHADEYIVYKRTGVHAGDDHGKPHADPAHAAAPADVHATDAHAADAQHAAPAPAAVATTAPASAVWPPRPADHSTIVPAANADAGVSAALTQFVPVIAAAAIPAEAAAVHAEHHYTSFEELHPTEQQRLHLFFQVYFAMTGLHGLHVLIGMALIAWVFIKTLAGVFSPTYYAPVEIVGLYWHLVDLIWIFLFPLLYLIH